MQQTTNNSEVRAEQAASKKHQSIKLGLDVHADTIVVVRILDHSAPQPAQRMPARKFLDWVKTQFTLAEEVHSCYEAGPFGYGLHRALVKLGVKNVVVQPVCLDERHTGVNHDKSDAKELALRLDRYVAGNTHALAIVRVPTLAEEQKRCASRQREQLKREVQRLAAQGRSLLLTQSWRGKNLHLLPITKHGNVRLRTALIELAWRLVVWQPQCKLVRKWWPIIGSSRATKAARKKAIVAMARQMAVDLWRWRTQRVTPAQLGWNMVGV